MDSSNGELYYKVTDSSWERHNPGGLRLVVKNDAFCGNYRRDISRGSSEVVQRQCVEVTWVTKECSIRQRTPVCGRVDKEVE